MISARISGLFDVIGRAGIPATAGLTSATGDAARACGLADRTGRLHVGLDADLLLVDGDPTTDITTIRNVRVVNSRGRLVTEIP